MGTEARLPRTRARVLGERLPVLHSQLLGGQPPVALHSSAGERPQGPVPTELSST